MPNKIAMAIIDVCVVSAAVECLLAIWPRMVNGGIFFTHSSPYIKVMNTLLDGELWKKEFNEYPPIYWGTGYGMGDASPHLGFMAKGSSLTPEYIKSLTIDK